MNLNNLKKTECGFSIVEVLVACTLLTFIALGTSALIQNQLNSSSFLDDKSSRRTLENEILDLFSDGEACKNTFAGGSITPTIGTRVQLDQNNQLFDASGNIIFDTSSDDKSSYDFLRIERFELFNRDIEGSEKNGKADLMIHIIRSRPQGMSHLQSIRIPLNVSLDSSNKITTCSLTRENNGNFKCLRPFAVQRLHNNVPINVPADATAMKVIAHKLHVDRDSGSGGGNGSIAGESSGHDGCSEPVKEAMILLSGEHHPQLVAGKRLVYAGRCPQGMYCRGGWSNGAGSGNWGTSGEGGWDYKYNNALLIEQDAFRDSCKTTIKYNANLPTCFTAADPSDPTPPGVVFYKESEL